MSDTLVQVSTAPSQEAPAAELGGVELLRAARERAGLHVVALAAMLKVPVQKLEALEAGRFDELPDATFARALASSVCRTLKIDAAPVLASLPQAKGVRLVEEGSGLNAPFPLHSARAMSAGEPVVNKPLSKPAVAALVMFFLAGLLWFLLPEDGSWSLANLFDDNRPDAAQAVVVPAPLQTTDALPQAASEQAHPEDAAPSPVAVSSSSDAVGAPASSSVPAQPVAEVSAAVTPVTSQAAAEAPAQPVDLSRQPLTLKAKEASWVQVTGASGRVLIQRSLQSGEVVSVGTDLPLTVVIGRADETEVLVRGVQFDLTPHARNNVARFEVR